MEYLTIKELILASEGQLVSKCNEETIVSNIVIDSRKAGKDSAFVAIVGENLDGHNFINLAINQGCKTIIKNKNNNVDIENKEVNVIEVSDTEIALGDIAKFYKNKFKIPFIAVTGSVGKTTTRDMVYSTISAKYNSLKNVGNLNNQFGVPLTLFNLNKEHECAVIEMGMSGFNEIEYLANIVNPQIGIISNIGYSHVEQVEVKNNTEKVNFKETLNIIRKNDQLVVFIGIVLFMNLIMQIIGGVSLYYFKYVIGNDKLNQVFYAFSGLAEIGGLMLFPILTKKIGRQDVFKVGSVLPILGCSMLLVFGIIAPKNAAFIAVSGIVLKLGTGMLLGATTVMLADVVDYGQFKLGTRNESIVFSVQTLLVKTASAVSGWLVGVGLSVVGYVPNATQGASTIFGLRVLMIGLPMLCAILMYVIYKQKYKINGKFHDMILNELKNKKDKEAVI